MALARFRFVRALPAAALLTLGCLPGCGTGIYENFADAVRGLQRPFVVYDPVVVPVDRRGFSIDFGFLTAPFLPIYDPGVVFADPPFVDPYFYDPYYYDPFFDDPFYGAPFFDDGFGFDAGFDYYDGY